MYVAAIQYSDCIKNLSLYIDDTVISWALRTRTITFNKLLFRANVVIISWFWRFSCEHLPAKTLVNILYI